jgi:hypothetical protein
MKSIFSLIILVLFYPVTTEAQVTKMYAYGQDMYGGAAIDKTVQPTYSHATGMPGSIRYYLYALVTNLKNLQFRKVWIKGEAYNCKAVLITTFPIVAGSSDVGNFRMTR